MWGLGYGTWYQGTDEARSSCVTLLLLRSSALNFHQEKINGPRLKDLVAENVLYGRYRGWGVGPGVVNPVGFTRALQGQAVVAAAWVASPVGRAAGVGAPWFVQEQTAKMNQCTFPEHP